MESRGRKMDSIAIGQDIRIQKLTQKETLEDFLQQVN